jgi:drug/metabolite transporter (DMT)-like permease
MSTPEDESSDRADARWSQADKRLLLITFAGGLAANIGVLMVVGAAIVLIRSFGSHTSTAVAAVGAIISALIDALGTALGSYLFSKRNRLLSFVITYTVFGLLVLIGYAVGISK